MRVRHLPVLLVTLLTLGLLSCWLNHPPDTPAAPSGPATCPARISQQFRVSAVDPDGNEVACRLAWGDDDTSEWTDWLTSGDSAVISHTWYEPGTYSITAQARDRREATSDWSGACAVTVTPNNAPDAPDFLLIPDIVQKDSYYLVTVAASDPNGDDVSYRVSWGDGDTSSWSSWLSSGCSLSMVHRWRAAGAYRVMAQTRDRARLVSPWSADHVLRVSTPPTRPLRPGGPLGLPRGTTRSFSTSALDPEGDSVAIRFSWGDGDTSAWSGFVPSGATVLMTHTWRAADTCEIAAQARDMVGALSPWSTTRELVITSQDMLVLWCSGAGDDIATAPAVDDEGRVYVGSSDRYLYVHNPDGSLRWRYRTGGSVRSSPAIAADGTVYFGSDDDHLYAVDAGGTLKWRFYAGGNVRSSPAVDLSGTVYFGSYDNYLYAVNPDSTLRWRFETGSDIRSSPAIAMDGTVYVGSDDNCLYAINADGTLLWRYETDGGVESSPVIGEFGVVYVGSDDEYLYAVSPDGALEWSFATGATIRSTPAVSSEGTVYVGSDDDCLYAVDLNGNLLWQFEADGNVSSPPAVGTNGAVYFGAEDGYLYVLQGVGQGAVTSWPKFHHDLKNTGRLGGGH